MSDRRVTFGAVTKHIIFESSDWKQYRDNRFEALDRSRFLARIDQLKPILEKVFNPQARNQQILKDDARSV